MCQYCNDKVEHDSDILCYKVVFIKDGKIYSPYHHEATWVLGQTERIPYEEKLKNDLAFKEYDPFGPNANDDTITKGAFHSFKSMRWAEKEFNYQLGVAEEATKTTVHYDHYDLPYASNVFYLNNPIFRGKFSVAILECVIPKESEYTYSGTSDFTNETYASQQLKPLRIVAVHYK